jgi:hypothetical protein
MTRLHGSRLLLLLLAATALGCALLISTATKAHAQSAVDQYLESNPDGKGGKGGGSGSGSGGSRSPGGGNSSGSGSGGSGSGGDPGYDSSGKATKDLNGDGTVNTSDDKIAAKKKKKKEKKDDEAAAAATGGDSGGTGGGATPAELANSTSPADNADGGGSGALWIVLALLLAGPLAVMVWWRFGPRNRRGDNPSEPQGT